MARPIRPLDTDTPDEVEPEVPADRAAEGLPDLAAPPVGLQKPPAAKAKVKKRYGVAFWLAVAWLVLVVLGAITASWLPIKDPLDTTPGSRLLAPGEEGFLLGTDGLGRDVLARLVFGARVSLVVGFATVTIGMVIGGTLGLIVGFYRGWIEKTIMAIADVVLAFPGLVILLGLLAFVGQSLMVISVTIGLLAVPRYTRVARANTLAVAEREFVLAARAMGAKNRRIIFRELLPNVMLPVAAYGLVAVAIVIVLEGSLAFLGLSVEQPTPTWGAMIAEGKRHLRDHPYVAAIPATVMFLTVLSLNFVGDKLRSLFDVRESGL